MDPFYREGNRDPEKERSSLKRYEEVGVMVGVEYQIASSWSRVLPPPSRT